MTRSSGFSLVELMFATAIGLILSLGSVTMIQGGVIAQQQATTIAGMNTVFQSVVNNIGNSVSWQNTITRGITNGSNMGCIAQGTPCTIDGLPNSAPLPPQNFVLYDTGGAVVFDSVSPTSGFTPHGQYCTTWANPGTAPCTLRYVLQWQPLCKVGNCVNPPVKVSAALLYTDPSKLLPIDPSHFAITVSYVPPTVCTHGFQGFASQLGGGAQTSAMSVLPGSCVNYFAGSNTVGTLIPGATEYGPGNTNGRSVFLAELDYAGRLKYASEYLATGVDANVVAMVQDTNQNFYIGGWLQCHGGGACSNGFGGSMIGTDGLPQGNTNAFIMKFDANGVFKWVVQIGGGTVSTTNTQTLNMTGMVMGASNTIYFTGTSTIDLGGTWTTSCGNGCPGTAASSLGSQNMYLAALNSNGGFQWVTESGLGAGSIVTGSAIAVDAASTVYVTGSDVTPPPPYYLPFGGFTQNGTRGYVNGVVWQYSPTGHYMSMQEYGNGSNLAPAAIGVDSTNNVWLSGTTNTATTVFGSVGLHGIYPLGVTFGETALFLMKVSPSSGWGGSWSVLTTQGATFSNANFGSQTLAIDSANNIFVAGKTNSYLGGKCYNSCGGPNNMFVAKFNNANSFLWVSQFGQALDATLDGAGIALDSGDNIYIAAETAATLGTQYGSHSSDALFVDMDSSGNMILPAAAPTPPAPFWPIQVGTGPQAVTEAKALVVDAAGNSYSTGVVGSVGVTSCYVWPVTSHCYGVTQSLKNTFVQKVDPTGVLLWFTQLGGGSGNQGNAITLDQAGNVVVGGQTSGDTFPGATNLPIGAPDAYVAKFNANDGSIIWATFVGDPSGNNSGYGVTADSTGNVFMMGTTTSNPMPTPTSSPTMSTIGVAGGTELFAAEFNSAGRAQWITEFDLGAGNSATSNGGIVNDGTNLYLLGTVSNFSGATNTYGSPGTYNAIVLSYPMAGGATLNWSSLISGGGGSKTYGRGLTVAGDIYISGYTDGSFAANAPSGQQFGNHSNDDAYAARISSAGGVVAWASQLGAIGTCTWGETCGGVINSSSYGTAVVVDLPNSQVYVSGYTNGVIAPNGTQYGSHYNSWSGGQGYDAFVLQFAATGGTYEWASQIGVDDSSAVYVTQAFGLALTSANGEKAMVTGVTSGYLNGTQYGSHATNWNASPPATDAILLRIDANGVMP